MKDKRIEEVLDMRHKIVCGEGGDGDAYWITKWFTIIEISSVAERLNQERWHGHWNITVNDQEVLLDNDQEYIVVTTSSHYEIPNWAHYMLRY